MSLDRLPHTCNVKCEKPVVGVSPNDLNHWITLQFLFIKSCVFLWVENFLGLSVGFARLPTLLRTYITGCICLTENKIWVFHPRGGICPILLHLNTLDLVLLLFYTTVSLSFGRCPISKLTTHSPRMVNNQYHAHTPDLT